MINEIKNIVNIALYLCKIHADMDNIQFLNYIQLVKYESTTRDPDSKASLSGISDDFIRNPGSSCYE